MAYRLLGITSFGAPFIPGVPFIWGTNAGVPFIWGATPGVPFITWGLMAYRCLGEVVPDLANINISGVFFWAAAQNWWVTADGGVIYYTAILPGQLLWVPMRESDPRRANLALVRRTWTGAAPASKTGESP